MQDKTLQLHIEGRLNRQELLQINQEADALLKEHQHTLKLVLDVTNLEANYVLADELRTTQSYLYDGRIDQVFVITASKLNHLIMLIAFSTCRADCVYFSTPEQAFDFLQQRMHKNR